MDPSLVVLRHLAEASVRPVGLAVAGAAALWMSRARSASTCHAVWTLVMAGMLLLPVAGPALPSLTLRVPRAAPGRLAVVPSAWLPAFAQGPTPTPPPADRAPDRARSLWRQTACTIYLAGMLAFLGRLLRSLLFVHRLVRASQNVDQTPGLYESDWISVPMTLGWIRPKILLPAGWREWDGAKLEAALVHERIHARRADWAIALLASLNHCVFWFHPLAWWLERKLSMLAEQACDDAALLVVRDRERYAQALLDMAAAARSGQGRLTWEALAMAKRSQVSTRIERVLDETRPTPRTMTKARWAMMAACSLPLIYGTAVVQLAPAQAPVPAWDPVITPSPSPYLNSLVEGNRLTSTDTENLEQYLETNPEDLEARGRLIAYYFLNAVREPRLKHIFWLIAHHPESELSGFNSAGISPRPTFLNDESEFARAGALWRQQVARFRNDPRVLGNAAQFFAQPGGNFDAAEEVLKRARALEPGQRMWTERLALLYTAAIASTATSTAPPRNIRLWVGMANAAFAERVQAELEKSTDGWLLAVTGRRLAAVARRPGQLPETVPALSEYPELTPVVELGERLMQRAKEFGVR